MKIATGVVHKIPDDLKKVIIKDLKIYTIWQSLTPLSRNEWICWVQSAKKDETRERRMDQTVSKLSAGMRRPCCWAGCIHRSK